MDRRSASLLFTLAAIWGASYLLIKIGGRDLSPPMVAFGRIAFGALVLVPVAHRAGALRNLAGLWPVLVIVSFCQVAAPFLLIALGEEEISSSLAGILVASAPIFTAILAVFFAPEERSQGAQLLGVVVGLAGLVLLLGLDVGDSLGELLGGLAVVLAGLGYAIGGLLAKQRLGSVKPIGTAALVLLVSVALSLPAALATLPSEAPGIGPVAAVVTLGVVGTGIAFAIFYELIATVGPARTFLVTYLAPVFAVAYGVVLLDESFTAVTFAGLLLILGGSWLAAGGVGAARPDRDPAP
ncbi:MAG: DMT family transporter [Solirubrobacterales bacterium]